MANTDLCECGHHEGFHVNGGCICVQPPPRCSCTKFKRAPKPPPAWEIVISGEKSGGPMLQRAKVPGGWLYRCHGDTATTFVSEPSNG